MHIRTCGRPTRDGGGLQAPRPEAALPAQVELLMPGARAGPRAGFRRWRSRTAVLGRVAAPRWPGPRSCSP
ncbi:hypothetical protein LV779_10615 [Streptomyces thinghirensis]|nr:hypothetical protein [Streptomyces thinghirensis]